MDGGELIREARLRAGLTQAELARRVGTKQPVIARWEKGRSPTFATVHKVIRACGLDLHVALAPHDDNDERLITLWRRLTPTQRVERNRAMLQAERQIRNAARDA